MRKSLMEFAHGRQNPLKIPNGRHEITKVIISSSIIEINIDKIISTNDKFLLSKNTIRLTIHLFDIIIMLNAEWPS